MAKARFLIFVVTYRVAPKTSTTLLSLSKSRVALYDTRVVVRDNSPERLSDSELAQLDSLLLGLDYEYRHNGRNEALSTLYNEIRRELLPGEHLILFDHDSAFGPEFFAEARRSIAAYPSIDLFLPLVYTGDQLVSPSHMVLFKGRYLSQPPLGPCPSRHAMAINSGMVISARYLQGDFPGYDEEYRFYLTDCDFMWTYQRLRSQYVALACTMSHSLDFYDAVEPTEKKLNRFREMRRGFLVAMRKRSWLAYALCYLYMDVYSVKFALLHRNVRFLFVR